MHPFYTKRVGKNGGKPWAARGSGFRPPQIEQNVVFVQFGREVLGQVGGCEKFNKIERQKSAVALVNG